MITAVYPGTFDPLTRGHEDLVRRAAGIFETLIVGVADSRSKGPFFTLDERLAIAREALGHYPNVRIESFTGLLRDLCAVIGRAWWCAGCAPSRILSMSFRWRG